MQIVKSTATNRVYFRFRGKTARNTVKGLRVKEHDTFLSRITSLLMLRFA